MAYNLDDYEPVADRIARFWEDHPEGRILTQLLSQENGSFVVAAACYTDREDGQPVATGLAQENVGSSNVNKTSALENCETSAIGRALANLNYATKGQRPSREEMEKAQRGERTATRPPGTLSPAAVKGLERLNEIAKIEEPSERVAQVASWKGRARDLGVLEESSVIGGTLKTLDKYADEIATGALVTAAPAASE